MIYNLSNYRYKNGCIYKQWFLFIYLKIEDNSLSYMEGVRRVNYLAGIKE